MTVRLHIDLQQGNAEKKDFNEFPGHFLYDIVENKDNIEALLGIPRGHPANCCQIYQNCKQGPIHAHYSKNSIAHLCWLQSLMPG